MTREKYGQRFELPFGGVKDPRWKLSEQDKLFTKREQEAQRGLGFTPTGNPIVDAGLALDEEEKKKQQAGIGVLLGR